MKDTDKVINMYCELKYIKHQTKGFFNDLRLKIVSPSLIISFIFVVTTNHYFNDEFLKCFYIILNIFALFILYYNAYKYCRK